MNDLSYNEWPAMSDMALLQTIGRFIQHHRLQQNKSQQEVAEAAGISRSTLSLLERGDNIATANLLKVLRVLDLLHVMEVFQVRQEISPVEYAKLQKNKKQRAHKIAQQPKGEVGW
jgi:transcriptional regulator with XRE-family HTH domain